MSEPADTPTISGEEYLQMQLEEIQGSFNVHVAKKELGREPTPDELAWHYINNGGAKHHAEEHAAKVKS